MRQNGETRLIDVANKLESAFRSGGYHQTGYYRVPGGFALVSQLEQFKRDGSPADESYRWSQQIIVPRLFSVEYLSALIRGRAGHYRVIVFAVSDDFFAQQTGKKVDVDQAGRLAIEGANRLPFEVGRLPFTDSYTCTALIYEFEKTAADNPAQFKENGTLWAETHLQRILPYLKR